MVSRSLCLCEAQGVLILQWVQVIEGVGNYRPSSKALSTKKVSETFAATKLLSSLSISLAFGPVSK